GKIDKLDEAYPARVALIAQPGRIPAKGRFLRCESLPALPAAGGAFYRRIRADAHMPEFAGNPGRPSIYLPIKDNSSSDSVLDKHQDEIPYMTDLRPSKPQFG